MTTAVLEKELEYIAGVREDKFRPEKFREIFGPLVTSDGMPAWMQSYTVHKVVDYASLVPTQYTSGDLPQPSFEKLGFSFPVVEYGCAFTVYNRELDRAAATGIRADTRKATANDRAKEQLLDTLACVGSTLTGIPGLCNNADVDTVTAITKAGTGTTWGVATAEEIVEDCMNLIDDIPNDSLENTSEGSVDLILPLAQRRLLYSLQDANGRTAEEVLRANNPYIRRILTWNRLSVLGAGVTPRAVAADLTREETAKFLLLQDLTDDAPRSVDRGYKVVQTLVTGGVISEDPTGIAYMDAL